MYACLPHIQVSCLQRHLQRLCPILPSFVRDPSPLLQRILRALAYMATPPPATSPTLLDLPVEVLMEICKEAGTVEVRRVCRRLRDAYGGLFRLHPLHFTGVGSGDFRAALNRPTLLRHLTSLDLSHVGDAADGATTTLLAAHCTALKKLTMGIKTDYAVRFLARDVAVLARAKRTRNGPPVLPELVSTLEELDVGAVSFLQASSHEDRRSAHKPEGAARGPCQVLGLPVLLHDRQTAATPDQLEGPHQAGMGARPGR
jgi:hypothetical protein